MGEGVSPAIAGLGIGLALASAPGPVQAVLLAEAHRGGVARGFRAMAGSIVTFGLLLAAVALGLTLTPPGGPMLRVLEGAGGAFLLWLAFDGFRTKHPAGGQPPARESSALPESLPAGRESAPPVVRGALAVLLNPGAWIFLGTVASSLLSAAGRNGLGSGLLAALALLIGCAIGDGAVVVFGGVGLRRADARVGVWVRRTLATLLGVLGLWLVHAAVTS